MRYHTVFDAPPCFPSDPETLTVRHDEPYRVYFHEGRPKNAFVLTSAGRMRYVFDEACIEPLAVGRGAVVFLPAGLAHETVYEEPGSTAGILFFDLVGERPAFLAEPFVLTRPRALSVMEGARYETPFDVYAALFSLFSLASAERSSRDPAAAALDSALAALSTAGAENRPIGALAKACGMSEAVFRRKFHAFTGMSPVDYRNKHKLHRAKLYIESGEYSVGEAASLAGFGNLSFFYRLYARTYGTTPGKGKSGLP